MSNRLIGRLPKVGIRPVIDGRERGIRESLEEQTMNMARAAARLIETSLRFPSGEKVECVISDITIGGVADAALCADQLEEKASVFLLLSRRAGAMVQKLWIVIHCFPRPSGVLTVRSVPGLCTWPLHLQVMRRKACLHSAFMAAMCRMQAILKYLMM